LRSAPESRSRGAHPHLSHSFYAHGYLVHDELLIRALLQHTEIEEIKSVPYAPVSHPFVERPIGTIRRELLDRAFFWNATDLARKLDEFRTYYNTQRVHRALDGVTPTCRAGNPPPIRAVLASYRWQSHCRGLFQTPQHA
jgi:putative transposase